MVNFVAAAPRPLPLMTATSCSPREALGTVQVMTVDVAGLGLAELKDVLWRTINDEDNRIPTRITHRDLDITHRVQEEDNFVIEQEGGDDTEEETWDVEWPDEYWEEDFKDD